MKKVLRFPVKRRWWEDIKAGRKLNEFRLVKEYWEKRLVGREYDEIHVCLGYPKAGDRSRILRREWRGFQQAIILHEEFGPDPVPVYAIDVSIPLGDEPGKFHEEKIQREIDKLVINPHMKGED